MPTANELWAENVVELTKAALPRLSMIATDGEMSAKEFIAVMASSTGVFTGTFLRATPATPEQQQECLEYVIRLLKESFSIAISLKD